MKQYKVNRGMVLVDICGTGALVATKAVRKECPYILPFNDVAVSFWKLMEQEKDPEEIVRCVAEEYEVDAAMVRRDLDAFLDQLAGYNCVTLS